MVNSFYNPSSIRSICTLWHLNCLRCTLRNMGTIFPLCSLGRKPRSDHLLWLSKYHSKDLNPDNWSQEGIPYLNSRCWHDGSKEQEFQSSPLPNPILFQNVTICWILSTEAPLSNRFFSSRHSVFCPALSKCNNPCFICILYRQEVLCLAFVAFYSCPKFSYCAPWLVYSSSHPSYADLYPFRATFLSQLVP